ncbi:MAG TPA: extracellular solute-binding protein [Streptosporangiaceae bacterium]|nr:extracellular solute-binding protein [Streptosporangiaceae bacterium]
MEAFAKECPAPAVSWDRQSLADLEARPVTELAQQYDVMIIDHPGLGAAIAAAAIQPLRRLVPRDVEDERKATSFVPTWDSYVAGGQPWALPVDAATQASVYRPDLLPGAPGSWAEVPALARERRVALCLGGPHAFLAVLGMCAPGESRPDRELLPAARDLLPAVRDLLSAESAVTAIELLRAVRRYADREVSAGDPIAVHEAMAASADLAYCAFLAAFWWRRRDHWL